MAIEIERKFLVKGDFLPFVTKKEKITQAYICTSPGSSVRIRIKDENAFITIKGPSNKNGFSHLEFEYAIPIEDAKEMLKLCEPGSIDKERHFVPCGKHTFEVDVFHGHNEGLVLAELELESENEQFEKPEWIGKEVTGDIHYYNSYLACNKFVVNQ